MECATTAAAQALATGVLGLDRTEAIKKAKLLVVGAGGIGCELIKNLVLVGFEDILVIDLDTIDVSNLNRQFLFTQSDVGKPKAEVAAAVANRLRPGAKVVGQQINVKTFNPDTISAYTLVINALDNLDARRHVNRICLAAKVPLLESATEGYMGYVSPIMGGVTECFDCQARPSPTVFAVCTIRSHPSEPIHSITWAKMLFARFWGEKADENAVTTLDINAAAASEDVALMEQAKRGQAYYVFHQLFKVDLDVLAAMKDKWKTLNRKVPLPLTYDEAVSGSASASSSSAPAPAANGELEDERIWDLATCAKRFVETFTAISKHVAEAREQNGGQKVVMEWDKDNPDALDFVVAASNLRSWNFHIKALSRFEVKAKAGNIVPAIATSNAIVGGLLTTEAIKVVSGQFPICRNVHLSMNPGRLLVVLPQQPPQSTCYVCGNITVKVGTNVEKATLGDFVSFVLKKAAAFSEPNVFMGDKVLYECGAGLEDDEIARYQVNLTKTLEQHGIQNGSLMTIDDTSQAFKLQIQIVHDPKFVGDNGPEELFDVSKITRLVPAPAPAQNAVPEKPESEDEVEFLGTKRKHDQME